MQAPPAAGRARSPPRAWLNATTWSEFTQEEVDAMPPSGPGAPRKKAEHDARTAQAAIDDLKRRTALRDWCICNAIVSCPRSC